MWESVYMESEVKNEDVNKIYQKNQIVLHQRNTIKIYRNSP